ncbi:MAG: pyridoxal-phosphate dependent enzyme [Armatimonadetes bacterium]|nr:pyridoxal-phosphate dependent enzyme [Armatimonadota bacterium]
MQRYNKLVVGATPLRHARKLGETLGLPRLSLKLEGCNPTHTHKDRAAARLVTDAAERGAVTVTTGTCGNYGVSLSWCAKQVGLRCVVCVPEPFTGRCIGTMEENGAEVIRVGDTYEAAVAASSGLARARGFYDANPTGDAGRLAQEAYSLIASEMCEALGGVPDSVWVSVGNGTTLAGVYDGFVRIGTLPALCGVGSDGNTAAIASALSGKVVQLDPEALVVTHTNEPLVNWDSFQAAEVVAAIRASRGIACGVSDEEMVRCSEMLSRLEDVRSLPAAAAALAGMIRFSHSLDASGRHVVLLTG